MRRGPPRPRLEAEHGQERAPEVRAEPKASSRGLGTAPREPRRELLRGFGAGRLGRFGSAFPRSEAFLSHLCAWLPSVLAALPAGGASEQLSILGCFTPFFYSLPLKLCLTGELHLVRPC